MKMNLLKTLLGLTIVLIGSAAFAHSPGSTAKNSHFRTNGVFSWHSYLQFDADGYETWYSDCFRRDSTGNALPASESDCDNDAQEGIRYRSAVLMARDPNNLQYYTVCRKVSKGGRPIREVSPENCL